MERYERQRVIGQGSYGQAVLVRRKEDRELFVVKEVKLHGLKHAERREARAECQLLSRLNHTNIVRYVEHFEQRQVLHMVMEFAAKGDLDSMLRKHRPQIRGGGLPEPIVLQYFAQLSLGLKYLHDRHILHRDIKSANVFVTSSNVIKIGDFGISTVLRNTFALARTVCGTPYYFSPELCQNRPYNSKSDVWALGCVLYELCTLRHPFDARNIKQLMQRIVRGQFTPIAGTYDPALQALVQGMLSRSDKQRPSVAQVIATPVVRQGLADLHISLGEATLQRHRLANLGQQLRKAQQPEAGQGHGAAVGSPREACRQRRGSGDQRGDAQPRPRPPPPQRPVGKGAAAAAAAPPPPDPRGDRGPGRVAQAKALERARGQKQQQQQVQREKRREEEGRRQAEDQRIQERAQRVREWHAQEQERQRLLRPGPGAAPARQGYRGVCGGEARDRVVDEPQARAGVRLLPIDGAKPQSESPAVPQGGRQPEHLRRPPPRRPNPGHRRRGSAPVAELDKAPTSAADLPAPHLPPPPWAPQSRFGGGAAAPAAHTSPTRDQPAPLDAEALGLSPGQLLELPPRGGRDPQGVRYGRRRSVSDERFLRSPQRGDSPAAADPVAAEVRRRLRLEEEERGRELAYQRMQEQKSRALNELLLREADDGPAGGGSAAGSSGGRAPPAQQQQPPGQSAAAAGAGRGAPAPRPGALHPATGAAVRPALYGHDSRPRPGSCPPPDSPETARLLPASEAGAPVRRSLDFGGSRGAAYGRRATGGGAASESGASSASGPPGGSAREADGRAQDSDDAAADGELGGLSEFVGSAKGTPPRSQSRGSRCSARSSASSSVVEGAGSRPPSSSSDSAVANDTDDQEYRAMMADITAVLSAPPRPEDDGSAEFGDDAVGCLIPALRSPEALRQSLGVHSGEWASARQSSDVSADLGMDAAAPLSERAEVLRQFLERELGADAFLAAYRYLADGEEATDPQRSLGALRAALAARDPRCADDAPRWQALVAQLVFVDDQLNRDQLS